MKNVTVYSTPTCHFCQLTKDFLSAHRIPYTDYNVAEDVIRRQEMIDRSGQLGVPVIFVDKEMVIGFDEERLKALLGVS